MAILLGSLVVLGHLAAMGRKRANGADDLAAAHRICQTRLDELLAGVRPLEAVPEEALDDEPGWCCSVVIDPAERPGLSTLRVTVRQDLPKDKPAKQFTLVRWVRDPLAQPGGAFAGSRRMSSGFPGGPAR